MCSTCFDEVARMGYTIIHNDAFVVYTVIILLIGIACGWFIKKSISKEK